MNRNRLDLTQSSAVCPQSIAQPIAQSIAFIDRALQDYEMLAAGVLPNTEVILLDPAEDGVRQISQVLAKRRELSSIHLVSHGAPGKVLLGNAELSQETLDRYADDLQIWAAALAPAAELLIYGCEVAKGDRGEQFIHLLSELTGAAVAASSTTVGDATLGGNWNLDVVTGAIASSLAFSSNAIATYSSVFNNNFANRIVLSGINVSTTGTNVGATGESGEPNHAGVSGDGFRGNVFSGYYDYGAIGNLQSVWWSWTAPTSGYTRINTLGSNFDTTLAVYTGSSVSALSFVSSNDNYYGSQSEVSFWATAGTTYQIAVDGWYNRTGSITLNINGNDAPVAVADTFTVLEDSVLNVSTPGLLTNDSDPDGTLPYWSFYYLPYYGTVTNPQGNGSFTYTPYAGFYGSDSFQYQISDGYLTSNFATATINVIPVNDRPSFTKGSDLIVNEDTGAQAVYWASGISPGDYNEWDQALTFLTSNNNTALFAVQPSIDSNGILTYTPTANAHGTATVTVQLKDSGGTSNGGIDTSIAQTFTITINPVNDAPVLTTASPNLISITEDDINSSGQTVASISNTITDVDAGAVQGIALTGLTSGNGTWQYSTNNGSTWSNVGIVSTNSALLLRSSDLIRFVPDGNNGTTATFAYQAWDQTSGSAGTKVNASTNGGTTAFSTGQNTASIVVTSVNDAPTLTGNATLTSIPEDTTNPAGSTIANLFSGLLSDPDAGASLKGVAVVSTTANQTTQGKWQYSTNSGSNWFDITSGGFALSASTLVRFVPVANYNGTPPGLVVRALDDTYAGNFTNGGIQYGVNTQTVGGTTPISANTATINTTVTAVNDVPTVTGTLTSQKALQGFAFNFTVPANTFSDADVGDSLTYSATLSNGAPLPAWLTFNATTRTFSGTPTAGDLGNLAVQVIATDSAGASISTPLALTVAVPQPGDLDLSFGSSGTVIGNVGIITSVVVQPDGKVVMAGRQRNSSTGDDFILTRYNADGAIDTTFGTNGSVTTHINFDDMGRSVVLQSDGKILVAGTTAGNFAVIRYSSNGAIDTTFGSAGIVTTDFGRDGSKVLVQSDGKVVVAGTIYSSSNNYDFGLVRYNSDGTVDTAFGNSGKLTTHIISDEWAYSAALQSDGKIVVGGTSDGQLAIVRYNSNGILDSTFGTNGVARTNVGGISTGRDLVIQPDGKILVAGDSTSGSFSNFAVVRYNSNGTIDTSFGNNGVVVTDFSNSEDYVTGIVLQSNGKFVVGGFSRVNFSGSNLALVRYNSSGTIDTSFGSQGKVVTDLGGDDYALDLALQGDGAILAAGYSFINGSIKLALTRYLGDAPNQAPTDISLSNGTIAENSANGAIVGTLTTLDPDGSDTHTYTLLNNAGGRFAINGNQIVVADGSLLNFEATNSHTIRIRATDNNGLDVEKDVTIAVSNVNETPVVSSSFIPPFLTEDSPFTFTIPADTFNDPDGDSLTYTATKADGSPLPAWVSFDAENRTFSGTPPQDAGMFSIIVTASDGQASTSTTFSLSVANVNDAPQLISEVADQTIAEDNSFSLVFSDYFTDPDSGMSYTATLENGDPLPAWLTFTGGSIVGTPGNGDAGTLNIKVTAVDNQYEVSDVFTLTVTNTNDAPVVQNPIASQTAIEDVPFSFTVPVNAFADPDGDKLTYTATLANNSPLPSWITFDPATHTFSGTPDDADLATLDIKVTATDPSGSTASQLFQVAISATDDLTIITAPSQQTINEDTSLVFSSATGNAITLSDVDSSNSLLQVSLLKNAGFFYLGDTSSLSYVSEDGSSFRGTLAAINAALEGLSFYPNNDYNGTVNLQLMVSNLDTGVSTSKTVSIQVNAVNDAPSLNLGIAPTVNENEPFSFSFSQAADPDDGYMGTIPITYTAKLADGSDLPAWINFDPNTRTFSGTPTRGNAGTLSIEVTASDGEDFNSEVFTLTIADATPPTVPTIGTIATDDIVNSAEKTAGITITGTADAGNTVQVTWGNTTLNAIADANGNWSQSFTADQIPADGNTTIRATATNTANNTSDAATRSVLIDTLAPDAPVITAIGGADGSVSSAAGDAQVIGTAEAGSTVEVRFGSAALGTVTADNDGNWAYTLTDSNIAAIGQGTSKSITARATDTAGNSSSLSTPRPFAVDTIAPNAPFITNVTDNVGSIKGTIADGAITNDTTPTFVISLAGTGAVVGNTVRLFNGAAQIAAFSLTSSHIAAGSVSVTPAALAQGSYSVTATLTDVAGNQSLASNPRSLTIDTTAPSAPAITLSDNVGSIQGTVPNRGRTDDSTPTFTMSLAGTNAVAGDTLRLMNGTNQLIAYTLTEADIANNSLSFTIDSLVESSYTVTARLTDIAGNQSTASSRTFTIDTTAPGAPLISSVNDNAGTIQGNVSEGSPTNDTTPTFVLDLAGTNAAAGDRVQLFNGNTQIAAYTLTSANIADQSASITARTPAQGNYAITARITDTAGNQSAVSGIRTFTIDSAAPSAPIVRGYTATSVQGMAEANATLLFSTSVTPLATFAATAIADAGGRYTINTSSLPGSTTGTTYSLYARDGAGNLSPANSRRVVVGTGNNDVLEGTRTNFSDLLVGGAGTMDKTQYAVSNSAISLTGQITAQNVANGSVNINTANIDVLTGIEQIEFTGTGYALMTSATPGNNQLRSTVQSVLRNNSVAAFAGTYDASTGNFTFGTGAGTNATLIAYDSNIGNTANYEALLVLDKTNPSGTISLSGGTVNLSGL